MRQISRLSVIAVSTALLITLSSCSSTQSTLEADDQPSTPIENREMTTDVQENKANGDSPQGSVTDAANFEITENEDGTVTISRYIGTETDIVIPSQIGGKTVSAIGNVMGTTGAFEGCRGDSGWCDRNSGQRLLRLLFVGDGDDPFQRYTPAQLCFLRLSKLACDLLQGRCTAASQLCI